VNGIGIAKVKVQGDTKGAKGSAFLSLQHLNIFSEYGVLSSRDFFWINHSVAMSPVMYVSTKGTLFFIIAERFQNDSRCIGFSIFNSYAIN